MEWQVNMYSLLYKLYFVLKRKMMKQPDGRLCSKIIGFIEAYYNLYLVKKFMNHPNKRFGLNKSERKQRIIVSLTSYPKRISTVWITLETLLQQSMKPDMIILWLASEQFASIADVPESVRKLQNRGLSIRFCKDLKSHKKYFYVMQEYPDDIIILADDDLFYPKDMIKKLYRIHLKNPEDIICMTAQIIYPDFMSVPSEWRNPYVDERVLHSYYAQAYTGTGTLFPSHSLPNEAFQEDLVMKLCPYADDLWLKLMSLKNNKRTSASYPYRSLPITIYGTGKDGLWYINGQKGENDKQWRMLIKHYPDVFDRLKKTE